MTDSGPQDMVTVNVKNEQGTKEKSFTVYKEFICYYSPFFDAAFNGSFREGETQTMLWEDVEPTEFALFVRWLYTQNVLDVAGHSQPSLWELTNLWILADRLLIPKLQNEVIFAFEQLRFCSNLPARCFERAYTTAPESALRRYIARLAVPTSSNYKGRKLENYPKELLVDMLRSEYKNTPVAPISAEELKEFLVEED